MSQSSYFQVSTYASSSNGWYNIRCNNPVTPVQWQSVSCGCIPFETGDTRFDCRPSRVPTKMPRSLPEGSTGDVICPPHAISHHFLAVKTPTLWVASSLWTDVNLVRSDLQDRDSFLDNGLADISLRVHSQQISWVFVWFIIPLSDL